MLVFFTILSLTEFHVRYLALKDCIEQFWMGSLLKNPVNAGVSKALFLVLHFSYYTLMTFLMMLSTMILLSTLSMIRHLICGNNLNWLMNLSLIYETLDWCSKWLVVYFNTGKTQLVLFDLSNNTGAVVMSGLVILVAT